MKQQECFPVGCVLSVVVAVSGGCAWRGGGLPQGSQRQTPPGPTPRMDRRNDTRLWKHYLLQLLLRTVNIYYGTFYWSLNRCTLEFFLNRAELSLNSVNSGNLKITEAWIWLNSKILSLHVSCWHYSNTLVSQTKGGCVAGPSTFTVMTNIFVTEFSEFSETLRKNSIAIRILGIWQDASKSNRKIFNVYCYYLDWIALLNFN